METATRETQTSRILKLLKTKGRVSNRELNSICFRYGARLHELRNDGHLIVSTHVKDSRWDFVYKGHEDDGLKDFAD